MSEHDGRDALYISALLDKVRRLEQENKALWDMVDDFNVAVKKAAERLP